MASVNKKGVCVLLCVTLFLLAGCTGGTSGPSLISDEQIYKGTDGITMEFVKGAPPSEAFDAMRLRIHATMENKGAFDVQEGYLALGIEDGYMALAGNGFNLDRDHQKRLTDRHLTFNLRGKSLDDPIGEETLLSIDALATIKDDQATIHPALIQITTCYPYQTKANADICIDTDSFSLIEREKACEIKDITLQSQGAPIAVTKIETAMLPQDDNTVIPHFIITMENKGKGITIKDDLEVIRNACTSSPFTREREEIFNKIRITAYLSNDDQPLDCLGSGEQNVFTIRDGKGTARCTPHAGIPAQKGTFVTPLRIELDYGYTQTIATEVKIRRIAS
ncbi:TPA: hypothetical protein HA270_05340 [Candidatus Woesearchaeota archaeon]|nr:hypothetical protein [Candidatus Woesearchaeota archaeon]